MDAGKAIWQLTTVTECKCTLNIMAENGAILAQARQKRHLYTAALLSVALLSSSSAQINSGLSVSLLGKQTVRIAWPSNATQWVLEQTDSLAATTSWQPAIQ